MHMQGVGESREGFFASLRRLLKTVCAIAQNRLELFLVELQEERWQLFDTLLLLGAVLILAAMTLMVLTVTIVVLCLRADRLDLLVALMLLYLVATIVAVWRLRVRLIGWAPFSATVAELKKDTGHYGSEFATIEDAQWLSPEQKKALLAKPEAAKALTLAQRSSMPVADRLAALEAKVFGMVIPPPAPPIVPPKP